MFGHGKCEIPHRRLKYTAEDIIEAMSKNMEDAKKDGKPYIRRNNAWQVVAAEVYDTYEGMIIDEASVDHKINSKNGKELIAYSETCEYTDAIRVFAGDVIYLKCRAWGGMPVIVGLKNDQWFHSYIGKANAIGDYENKIVITQKMVDAGLYYIRCVWRNRGQYAGEGGYPVLSISRGVPSSGTYVPPNQEEPGEDEPTVKTIRFYVGKVQKTASDFSAMTADELKSNATAITETKGSGTIHGQLCVKSVIYLLIPEEDATLSEFSFTAGGIKSDILENEAWNVEHESVEIDDKMYAVKAYRNGSLTVFNTLTYDYKLNIQ